MLTQDLKKDDTGGGQVEHLTISDTALPVLGPNRTALRVAAWIISNALAVLGLASALTAGRW